MFGSDIGSYPARAALDSYVVRRSRTLGDYYGKQLGSTPGVLQCFGRVFGREFSHHQRQFSVGCHLDRSFVDPLHIRRRARAALHPYNKFNVCHGTKHNGIGADQTEHY